MSTRPPLTDAMLEAALERIAARVSDVGLRGEIVDGIARTSQDRRSFLPTLPLRPVAPRPAAAWAAVLAALALVAVLAGMMLVGAPREVRPAIVVVPPSPTGAPLPSSTEPSPDLASPSSTISALLDAWRDGDVTRVEALFAGDPAPRFVGDAMGLEEGEHHFDVRPNDRGSAYWEAASEPLDGGPFWVLPGVAGTGDPGRDVLAIFRFDARNRIDAEWIIAAHATAPRAHEERKEQLLASGPEVQALLDGCADRTLDRGGAASCSTALEGFWVAAGDHGTAWTELYAGGDAVKQWLEGSSAYDDIAHTSAPFDTAGGWGSWSALEFGRLVIAPFTGGTAACASGIDVFELSPARTAVLRHWAFCGPGVAERRLTGVWSTPVGRPTMLVLDDCDVGDTCGTFERFDGLETCVYTIELRGVADGTHSFFSSDASSFGCAWSGWYQSILNVRPAPDGTLEVWIAGNPGSRLWGLRRVAAPTPAVPLVP